MNRSRGGLPAAHRSVAPGLLLALGAVALLSAARPAVAQSIEMPAATAKEEELPHPFFTHMGSRRVWATSISACSGSPLEPTAGRKATSLFTWKPGSLPRSGSMSETTVF